MSDNFILFFLLSLGFIALIFSLTVFFVYRQSTKTYFWPVSAFGSGILLCLIVFDFLPHALEDTRIDLALLFIGMGFAVNAFSEIILLPRIQFLNRFWPKSPGACSGKEHIHHHLMPSGTGCSALACLMLCAFFDGLRLASATSDLKTAITMGIGLLFHIIPESVTVLSIGLSAGFSRKSLIKISGLFCAAFLVGYQALFLLSHIAPLKKAILPFAGGLFLYVSCVHLIPMIFKRSQNQSEHKVKPFIMGICFCWLLLMICRSIIKP